MGNTYVRAAYRRCESCCIPVYLIRRRSVTSSTGRDVYQNLNVSVGDSSKPVPSTIEGVVAGTSTPGLENYNENQVLSPEKMTRNGLNDVEGELGGSDVSIELAVMKEVDLDEIIHEQQWMKLAKHSLAQVYQKITSPFDGFEEILNDSVSEQKIRIHARDYLTEKKHPVNIYRSEYIMPCSARQYINFMNDIEEQKKLDSKIDSYFVDESFQENYLLIFLQYKKFLLFSSRFFVYVKHFERLKGTKEVWVDVSKSIDLEKFPESKDKVKGEIVLGGSIIEEFQEGERVFCKVKTYSEMDFKLSMAIPKSMSCKEMKSYIEKCGKRLKEIAEAARSLADPQPALL